MALSILDNLVDKADGGQKSSSWYRKAVGTITDRISARRLMAQGKLIGRPSVGRLNLFVYDPKYKQTLPYYDIFPLVLPLEPIKNGFAGINFHYLPPNQRFTLLTQLQRYAIHGRSEISAKNRFDVSYNRIKKLPLTKNAIKKYLWAHTRSQYLRVDYNEAALAVYLPIAQFKKGRPY